MVATKNTIVSALSERLSLGDAGVLNGMLSEILPWLPLSWKCYESDPLSKLLNHSDCDGDLKWRECSDIADRLTELLSDIGTGEDPWGHIGGDWRAKTQTFIDGLRLAAQRKENVIFH